MYLLSLDGTWGRPAQLGHVGAPRAVAFSPGGRYLATGDEEYLRLWEAASGKEVRKFSFSPGRAGVDSVAFSPSGRFLAGAGFTEVVQLREVMSGRLVETFPYSAESPVVCFLPGDVLLVKTRREIGFYSPDRRQWLRKLEPNEGVSDFVVSPDGKLVAVVPYRILSRGAKPLPPRVDIYDAVTGKRVRSLTAYNSDVGLVAFFPDGKRLLSLDTGRNPDEHVFRVRRQTATPRLRIHRVATGVESKSTLFDVQLSVFALSPDGKTFAFVLSGGDEGVIHLGETATFKERRRIQAHALPIRLLSFSADGTRLASGSLDTTVRVWDLRREPDRTGKGQPLD
jgi:WD40 repeat protein